MWQANSDIFSAVERSRDGNAGAMIGGENLAVLLEELGQMSPGGFSAGLHIRFAAPVVYVRTYDEAWQKKYDDYAYALRDPLVFWGLGVRGATRWSAIKLPDPFNILGQARKFGLKFGAVLSTGPITSRSIVGIARGDREFSDTEIEAAEKIANQLHAAAEPPADLTAAQIEALKLVAEGYRHTAAAAQLGISESALKARLSAARARLGARTNAEALRKAREFRFL